MTGFRAYSPPTEQGSGPAPGGSGGGDDSGDRPPEEQPVPKHAFIDPQKITKYLMVERDYDDKSKFLKMLGFSADDPEAISDAILEANLGQTATRGREFPDGTSYTVHTELVGPQNSRRTLFVWNFREDDEVTLVTMFPRE